MTSKLSAIICIQLSISSIDYYIIFNCFITDSTVSRVENAFNDWNKVIYCFASYAAIFHTAVKISNHSIGLVSSSRTVGSLWNFEVNRHLYVTIFDGRVSDLHARCSLRNTIDGVVLFTSSQGTWNAQAIDVFRVPGRILHTSYTYLCFWIKIRIAYSERSSIYCSLLMLLIYSNFIIWIVPKYRIDF